MMKKMFVPGAAILAIATFAPSLHGQDVMLGVKGGLNVSDIDVSDTTEDADTDTSTGLVGGVFAEIGLGNVLAIRPEGLFSQKGASATDEGVDIDLSLDYIEFPVLLLARVPTAGVVRPVLFAGPVLSFEATCEVEGSSEGTTVTIDCDEFEDFVETKSTDFGLAFGGGLEVDAGGVVLLFDGRYTLGLSDLNDTADATEELKNRTWSFMGGVGFRVN